MKTKIKNSKSPDKKEWLQELASESLFCLTEDLIKLFFNESPDPESWLSNKSPVLYQNRHRLPYFLDVAYRAGDISIGLFMDTAPKPVMNTLWDYSAAMVDCRQGDHRTDGAEPKRFLYVLIAEHSCLEGKWFFKMKMQCMDMPSEGGNCEGCLPEPNILIIDLENFQKQVPAPQSFLEQFLKILAESRTLDEAREAVGAAVEKRYQTTLNKLPKVRDEIAGLEEEHANMESPGSDLFADNSLKQ